MGNTSQTRSGFSLVELLIVITIMVILGTVVGVQLVNQPQKANLAAARTQIGELALAVQVYGSDNGGIPSQRQGLQALVTPTPIPPAPTRFQEGGYLQSLSVPIDPWENPYAYLVPGRHAEPFEIVSYGRDGEEGGTGFDADLSSSIPAHP